MSSTTTVLTADAAAAADAALAQQLSDLTARVTALEQGAVKPPIPPVITPSPDGAKATGPGQVLVDDALNQWQLVPYPTFGNIVQWMPAGTVAWVAAGYSANVTVLEKWKTTAYQTNGTGWWSWDGATWQTAPGDPSAPVVPPVTTGTFTVTATGFLDPSGKAWSMRGLNASPQDALDGFGHLFLQYPHLTAIRLNCNSGDTGEPTKIAQVVQQYGAKGCVVMIEDHGGNTGNTAWYQQMANTYRANPYVFLECPNEPTDASPQHGLITAMRAVGFKGPIGIQPKGGWDFGTVPAAAAGQTNVFVTPHIYYNGNDPNGPANYVSSTVKAAHDMGLFASIDEFGEGIDGWHWDQYGAQVTSSCIAANQAGQAGAVYWAMDNDNHPDGCCSAFLTRDGSQLTVTGSGPIKGWLA